MNLQWSDSKRMVHAIASNLIAGAFPALYVRMTHQTGASSNTSKNWTWPGMSSRNGCLARPCLSMARATFLVSPS